MFIDQPFAIRASVFTFHSISFCASSAALAKPFLDAGVGLVEVEALADLETDPLQLRNNRLIGDVRGMKFEQLRRIGEVFIGRHGIDLDLRRRFHVDARTDFHFGRRWLATPLRQRCYLVAGLDLVHGIVIARAVCLGATDDPNIGRGRLDLGHAVRDRAGPTRRRDEVIACLRSGRPPSRRGKYVAPHVEHRQR